MAWLVACSFFFGVSASVLAVERTWTGGSGGAWEQAANWNPPGVPGPGDAVVISSGSPILSEPATVDEVQFTSGTLGLNGGLMVTGQFVWSGGSVSGALTIATGAQFVMTNSATRDLNAGAITNRGTAVLGGGAIRGQAASVIYNEGLWDIRGDLSIYSSGATTNRFVSVGTLRKTSGSGTASMDWAFVSNGQMETTDGALAVNWTGQSVFNGSALLGFSSSVGDVVVSPGSRLEWITGSSSGETRVQTGATLIWSGGDLRGRLRVEVGAELVMTNNATRDLNGGAITNLGTAVLGDGAIRGQAASVIHNEGLWEIRGNHPIYTSGSTTNRFVNLGTLHKSSGTGTASLDWKLLSTGALLSDAGQFSLDWAEGSVFGGDAQLTMDLGVDLAVATNAVLRWQNGSIRRSLTVSPGGTLVMTNNTTRDLNGGALTNRGTVVLGDGAIRGFNEAVIDNRGLWEVRGNHAIYTGSLTTNRFLNWGTLHKTEGAGTASIDWALQSTGEFLTDAGTLSLNWAEDSVFHGDAFVTLTLSSPLSVASNAVLRWNNGTIQAGGALTVEPGALLAMTNSTTRDLNRGAITNRGTVVFGDGGLRGFNASVVDNQGLWEIRGNHAIYTGSATTNRFVNGGLLRKTTGTGTATIDWALRSTGEFRTDAGTLNLNWTDESVFHGDAFVTFTLASRLSVASNAVLRWNGGSINGGALAVEPGGLLAMTNSATRDLNAGALTNRGTVLFTDGGLRGFNGSVVENLGVWELRGSPSIYTGSSTTNRFFNAGTLLKGVGTGSANIDWPVVSTGAVQMDAASGTLVMSGGYRQETTGRMEFELAGTGVGSGFGRVQFSGPVAELGGTLGVRLVEDYEPGVSNVFPVITWSSRQGEFTGYDGLAILTNRSLVANYKANGLDLVAIAATNNLVTPPTISLQPANQTVINGQSAQFDVTANGTRPLHYQWFFNGAPIPGAETFTLALPNAQTNQSGGYFVVVTNSAGSVTSVVATLTVRPVADLVVTDITHPFDAVAGQPVTLGWRTLNQGSQSALAPWSESVALSTNASGTPAVSLGTFPAMQSLVAAQSLVRTQSFILPGGLDGQFHVVVTADTGNQVVEELNENNNRTVSAGTIRLRSSDLAARDIAVLDGNGASVNAATFGQTVTVRWTTTNAGSATANAPWSDRIYLNDRSNSLSGATLLASVVATNSASSAGTITNESAVTLPIGASFQPDDYFILVATDSGNAVAESREDNNLSAQPLALSLPPLPDLAVATLSAPATLRPGETVLLGWTTTNRGSLSVTGAWTETVWLAANSDGSGRTELASFRLTNELAAVGSLARSRSVTLPYDGAVGQRWFVVTVDGRNDVFESDENNNLAVAPTTTAIPAELTLLPAVAEIREDAASPLLLSVTRNGSRSQALTVILANSDPSEVTVTNQVTIATGQASAAFQVRPVRDFAVDGLQQAIITATADGFTQSTARVSVVDADLPKLAWQLTTNRVREGFTLTATLTRDGALNTSLNVALASSSRAQLAPPDSVAFGAGEASVTFALLAVDDVLVEASGEAVVTASAAGYSPATTTVIVDDDDLPAVALSLSRTTVSEGAGSGAVVGTVTRSPVTHAPLQLDLLGSLPGVVQMPASITIPGGAGLATFAVVVTDNDMVDGIRSATLTPWIKAATGVRLQAGTAAVLEVTDDDGPTLRLTFDRDLVPEDRTNAATGTVTRNSTTDAALVVALASGDPSELTVPSSVTIPAGASSANFTVASVDDATNDGNQTVAVSASAAGFNPGTATVVVSDVDLPDFVIASINAPTVAETEAFISLGYFLRNQGPTAMASNTVVQRIWLATNAVPGEGDQLLGSFSYSGAMPAGAQVSQSFSLRMPQKVGDYWIRVESDAGDAVAEVLESNNALVSTIPLRIEAAYDAVVSTTLESAPAGTVVPLAGRAFKTPGEQPVPFVPVNIHITVQGTRRVIAALTDADGRFTAAWTPLPKEAGAYGIAAAHPGVASPAPQDGFRLYGMVAKPARLDFGVSEQTATTNHVVLENPGDVALSGLSVSVTNAPPEWDVRAELVSDGLPALGTNRLAVVVEAPDASIAQAGFQVRVTSAEGAVLTIPVVVTVESLRPRLAVEPAAIGGGMKVGAQSIVRVDLVNRGATATGPVTVVLPAVPWLSLVSGETLPSLAPSQTNSVTLRLAPGADLPLGSYQGTILFVSAASTATLPFELRALSEATGDLLVWASDEFTYYAEGSPPLAGAAVQVRDVLGGQVVTNGLTGTNGLFFAAALPEGYYDIEVTADQHTAYRGTHLLRSAITNGVATFLSRESVRYTWSVEPTEVEDRYRIVVETEFEANVPKPVVTIEPSVIDLADMTGDEMQVDLRIENHGLIAAQDFELHFDPHPLYTFTPLVSNLGTLPAKSLYTVPLTIRRVPQGIAARAQTDGRKQTADSPPCSASGYGIMSLICGVFANTYSTPIHFPNAADCVGRPTGIGYQPGGGGGGGGGGGFGGGGGGSGIGHTDFVGIRIDGALWVSSSTARPKVHPVVPALAVPALCDPCLQNRLSAALACLQDFLPAPPPELDDCVEDLFNLLKDALSDGPSRSTGYGGAKNLLNCTQAGKKLAKKLPLLGPLLNGISCADGLCNACSGLPGHSGLCGLNLSQSALDARLRRNVALMSDPVRSQTDTARTALARDSVLGPLFVESDRLQRVLDPLLYFFGSEAWLRVTDGDALEPVLDAFNAALDETSPGGFYVTEAERAAMEAGGLPLPLVPADVAALVARWNRSATNYDSGVFLSTQTPLPANADFIALDLWENALRGAYEAFQSFEREGVVDLTGPWRSAVEDLLEEVQGGSSGVCAKVRLRLEQQAVLTRDAFRATLEVENITGSALEDISVELTIKDSLGSDSLMKFGLRPPELSGLSAIDGTGMIAPDATGRVSWTFLPASDAAPETPVVHLVGGTLRYRQDGVLVTIPLADTAITVHPSPRLTLRYFHERDVFSDDPFTDAVEPTQPYNLAVMVENRGFGEARNFSIASAQPRIVDNEKGLLIDFKIIATEVAGQSLVPSLTADFGDVGAGETKVGRWLMTSTLQGLFTDYAATFEHVDDLGTAKLSLIDAVEIHEMNRLVRAGGEFEDGLPDFLVNDLPDLRDLPDTLWLSDGRSQPVVAVVEGDFSGAVSTGNLQVQLTVAAPGGWAYLRLPDPADGNFRLVSVVRSDSVPVPVGTNAWITDRTFVGLGKAPIREHTLHLLDHNSTGSYTLLYEPLPEVDTQAPTSAVTALAVESRAAFSVSWSGSDNVGVAAYDIHVSEDGGPFQRWLAGTTATSALYAGALGRSYAFYSVAIDAAGNREAAPETADATTVASLVNHAPVVAAMADVSIQEGETLSLKLTGSDSDGDPLSYSLVSAPAGVRLNATSGLLTWATGEADGSSTNLIRFMVQDDGQPRLSATNSLRIVVEENNTAPTLAALVDRTINEGQMLVVTNQAADIDLPAQTLTFSLGAGAPAGMTLHPVTGLLTWTPNELQGNTTNRISVILRDNGVPSLTATQHFVMTVRDSRPDFFLAIGSTQLLAGASSSLPLTLSSGTDLTNVTLAITLEGDRLTNVRLGALAGGVGSAELVQTESNRFQARFLSQPGGALQGDLSLARLTFDTRTNGPSAVVGVKGGPLLGERTSSSLVSTGLAGAGRVFVIGREPILDTSENNAELRITLYAPPGRRYALQSSPALGGTNTWRSLRVVEAAALRTELDTLPIGISGNEFFRVEELADGAELVISLLEGGVMVEWPADCVGCVLEESPRLGAEADWKESALPVETVGQLRRVAVPAANGERFFRLRLPGN